MVLDLSTKSTRKDIPDWLSSRKKWIRVLLVQVHDADRRLKECFRYHLIVCSNVDVVCSHKINYFGGARSKGFATLRNVSKLHFFDKIGHAKSVSFRFYSAI